MRKVVASCVALIMLTGSGLWAQSNAQAAPQSATTTQNADLKTEIEQLKKSIAAMEARLAEQEKKASESATAPADGKDTVSTTELKNEVKELNTRLAGSERKSALDRLNWSGDFRFQAHSYTAHIPTHFDGMQMQNYVVKSLFLISPTSQGGLGVALDPAMLGSVTTAQFTGMLNGAVQANPAQYQAFTNSLTFAQLKQAFGSFPPSMQQGLMGLLQPATLVNGYQADNNILYTNRLRLNLDAKVSENVSVTARLSMYKVFGDSTGVQVFNGQATSMNIDGTTTRVPNSDILRVERAYFTWNKIAGSPLYLSIGRRPSTDGPPVNFRLDEPRGGTPSGGLIDYQFDGITLGYHLGEKIALRACYGLGYESGFGSGDVLKRPADRLKDVHLLGGNFDFFATEKSLMQITIAKAWNVTDGFNGQMVLPNNPLTGEPILAPVVMRYTPSANLGDINLYGLNLTRRLGPMDFYGSFNWTSIRPNGTTTPFGGLMADPFDTPVNREGHMVMVGARFSVPKNDGRTKIGGEFNQGSKYWFNFAQAEDDIIAPKSSTRGEVYETYLTHRISEHFIFKADYIHYNYTYSGSGWHVQAPKRLSETPLLGFPTYDKANMVTVGLTARF